MNDRDQQLIKHMIRYCQEIKIAKEQFDSDKNFL